MPSDFTKEYKNYIESETPDLWSRIEAGIEAEEKPQSEKNGTTEVITFDDATYVNQTKNKKIIRWGVFAKRAGSLAAAIALVFVAYSFVKVMNKGGMQSAPAASESTAPMADSASAYEAEEAPVAEAAADDAADNSFDGAAAAEAPAAMAEDAEASMPEEAAEAPAEAPAAEAEEGMENAVNNKDAANSASAQLAPDYSRGESAKAEIYKDAVLTDMTELAPHERTNSPAGDQYKFGLTFKAGDEVISCLISEAELKSYAENGIHFKKNASYDIAVILREDHEQTQSAYPYVLKLVSDAEN